MKIKNPPSWWYLIIVAASFYIVFMAYGIRFSYGVLLPAMIKELGLSAIEAGIVGSLMGSGYFLAYSFTAHFVGLLTDRVGGRPIIALFCGILGAGTFMMGLISPPYYSFIFASALIMGMGASATWTPVVALVSKWFGPSRRGMALGILTTGYGWGFGFLGILLPLVVAHYGCRPSWYILALMALSSALINWTFLRSRPEDLGLKPWGREC